MEADAVLLATRFAVSQSARICAAERRGVNADTMLFPATQSAPRNISVLWVIIAGAATFSYDDQVTQVAAPCVVSVPEHWSEGANGKRVVRMQTQGEPFASVQVHFRGTCERLTELSLAREKMNELVSVHRRILDGDPEGGAGLLRALLWRLASFGLVPRSALTDADASLFTDPSTVRMWEAVRRHYAALDANPSLKSMASEADLSERHAHRIMRNIFNACLLPPGGFREATINLRLSFASILLSRSSLTVVEVARRAGYMHPETLANAFRHAGLPSPAEIKRTYAADRIVLS